MTADAGTAPAAAPVPPALNVVHAPAQGLFEAVVEGWHCELAYRLRTEPDGRRVADFVHTGVPRALQGLGIAAALVQAGLDWARRDGLRVRPTCSYVRVYMRRHPASNDLLAP
ncbi:MAG: hypothetical protein RJA44_1189 [Pseudomonadota bacterium]|jgi:predicted GNAT family acetyltransferase